MTLKSLVALLCALGAADVAAAQTLDPPSRAATVTAPPPAPALDPENTLVLDLTTGGRVVIQLRPDVAPNHVERIKTLTRRGFYNGLAFHRVLEGFMAQGGDPKGDGSGGSELPDLKAEFNGLPHVRGAVSAARTDAPDTANSQFFIMLSPKLYLDGRYTGFGRVVSGMNYVDAIQKGEPPIEPDRIVRASIGADNVPPPTPEQIAAAKARSSQAPLPSFGNAVIPAGGAAPAAPAAPAGGAQAPAAPAGPALPEQAPNN
jgi:peptidylprolyl isomerase